MRGRDYGIGGDEDEDDVGGGDSRLDPGSGIVGLRFSWPRRWVLGSEKGEREWDVPEREMVGDR